jgi:hypothetical protein
MERVLLFSMDTDHIKVTVEAFYDDAGNLVVEGYDIGKTVEEYWGDSDYEYAVTVPPPEVEKLCTALNLPGNRETLLTYLQAHYHQNDCYSKIRELLDLHAIQQEGFSWR